MSNKEDRKWISITICILVQPFLPPLGILPTIIHEAAHWLTAFFSGIPASEIKIGLHGIDPGITIPSSTPPEVLPYFFYSGGLVSGTILLILYAFYWVKQYRRHPSSCNWIMSMFTVFTIATQFYIGILEGRYYQTYPTYVNVFQLLIFWIAALACHAAIFYLISHCRKKKIAFHS